MKIKCRKCGVDLAYIHVPMGAKLRVSYLCPFCAQAGSKASLKIVKPLEGNWETEGPETEPSE